MNRTKRKRGFTLVEMMAVIFIIGLLVGAVAFPVITYLKKAKIETTKANMVKIKEAIQMYKMYKSKYPDTLQDLVPEYIAKETKIRDGWKNEFHYAQQGTEGDFELISGGPDGDINTTEDNIDIWKMNEDE